MVPKINYPRTCDLCNNVYEYRQGYSRHIKNGQCMRKQELILAEKNNNAATINNITNNIQNIQNITNNNNNVTLNVTIQQDFAELLKAPFQACSAKERKQIIDVLILLRDKGYKTASDIQNFIMDEYVTIQQMEQTVRNYDLNCLRVIAKEYHHADQHEHMTRCVVALFNRLICKDEPFITPDTLDRKSVV